MFKDYIHKILGFKFTFTTWITSVVSIIVIRIFLEQYSNILPGHFVLIDLQTLVQYTISFVAVLMLSMVPLLYFTKRTLSEVAALSLMAFPLIWTAPIFDLIFSRGTGYQIHYIFLNIHDLFLAFISEFWTTSSHGMTYGIRIEIAIILILTFCIVRALTHTTKTALYATLCVWLSIFTVDCLPSFLGIFQFAPVSNFIQNSIFNSTIISNASFSVEQLGFARYYEVGFNALMIQACTMLIFISGIGIGLLGYKEKFKTILNNARPERISYYALLVLVGVTLGGGRVFLSSWVNVLTLIMTILAFACAWIAAVCINDIHDISIDLISNPERPLPLEQVTVPELRLYAGIFFALALAAGYGAGLYVFFCILLYSAAFYLYSVPPIHLKQHFVGGILVVGCASVSAILSGFFISTTNHELIAFPPLVVLCIALFFGCGSMVKDIKDYEGDKACGMKTLPVVVGLRTSKIIIATIISIGLVCIGYYLGNIFILGVSVLTGIGMWFVLLDRNYREKRFFILLLGFFIVSILTILVK